MEALVRAPGASSGSSAWLEEGPPASAFFSSWKRNLVLVSCAGSSTDVSVEFGEPGRASALSAK